MSSRSRETLNQRLVRLGLYHNRAWWDPSKADHDNRIHDALDEVESLRAVLDRVFSAAPPALSEEQRRVAALIAEADAEQ